MSLRHAVLAIPLFSLAAGCAGGGREPAPVPGTEPAAPAEKLTAPKTDAPGKPSPTTPTEAARKLPWEELDDVLSKVKARHRPTRGDWERGDEVLAVKLTALREELLGKAESVVFTAGRIDQDSLLRSLDAKLAAEQVDALFAKLGVSPVASTRRISWEKLEAMLAVLPDAGSITLEDWKRGDKHLLARLNALEAGYERRLNQVMLANAGREAAGLPVDESEFYYLISLSGAVQRITKTSNLDPDGKGEVAPKAEGVPKAAPVDEDAVDPEVEERAIKSIQRHGSVDRSRSIDGRPVLRVSFYFSPVTNDGLKEVAYLKNLTSLSLTNAFNVTGGGLKHLAPLTNLEHLTLHEMKVTDADVVHLTTFKKLRSLELSRTQITDEGLKQLPVLDNLHRLVLGDRPMTGFAGNNTTRPAGKAPGTSITGDGLKHLTRFKNLNILELHGVAPTAAAGEDLARMPSLTTLGLHGPEVTDDGLNHLTGLKNLTDLGFQRAKITGAGLKHLAGLQKLSSLYIDGAETPITDDDLKHLVPLKNLKFLMIYGTRVTRQGAADLRRHLPNLNVSGVK